MSEVSAGLERRSWSCHDCHELLMVPGILETVKEFYESDKDGFYGLIANEHFTIGLQKSTKSGGKKLNADASVDWDNVFFLCVDCNSKRAEKKTITIRIRKEDYKRLQNKSNGKVTAKIGELIDDFLKD